MMFKGVTQKVVHIETENAIRINKKPKKTFGIC